jgi:hypothetical protein
VEFGLAWISHLTYRHGVKLVLPDLLQDYPLIPALQAIFQHQNRVFSAGIFGRDFNAPTSYRYAWAERAKTVGYVVRLLPDQFFSDAKKPRPEFLKKNPPVTVGKDAFVLYRTHDDLKNFPPMPEWEVRYLVREGQKVEDRGGGAEDRGHYVLRIAAITKARTKRHDGPPQGIFAPEYTDRETNYFCKCVWNSTCIATAPRSSNFSCTCRKTNSENDFSNALMNRIRTGNSALRTFTSENFGSITCRPMKIA